MHSPIVDTLSKCDSKIIATNEPNGRAVTKVVFEPRFIQVITQALSGSIQYFDELAKPHVGTDHFHDIIRNDLVSLSSAGITERGSIIFTQENISFRPMRDRGSTEDKPLVPLSSHLTGAISSLLKHFIPNYLRNAINEIITTKARDIPFGNIITPHTGLIRLAAHLRLVAPFQTMSQADLIYTFLPDIELHTLPVLISLAGTTLEHKLRHVLNKTPTVLCGFRVMMQNDVLGCSTSNIRAATLRLSNVLTNDFTSIDLDDSEFNIEVKHKSTGSVPAVEKVRSDPAKCASPRNVLLELE